MKEGGDIGKQIAFSIAKGIYYRPSFTRGTSPLETALNNIMEDHSYKDPERRSYFRTDDKKVVEKIIANVVNSPDSYRFYEHGRCELEISKTFDKSCPAPN